MLYRFAAVATAVVLVAATAGRAQDKQPRKVVKQPSKDPLAKLEARLFDPIAPAKDVDALLVELRDPKRRFAARSKLVRQGQGHQDRIIAFAATSKDPEVRSSCAFLVTILDRKHRFGPLGKRLATHYKQNAGKLLPGVWERFRKNANDRRAVAAILGADPDAAWKWLGKRPDSRDRIRYLLLRIRERSPDSFAAEHIFEFAAPRVKSVLRDVFPHTRRGAFSGAHRIVGHIVLNRIEIFPQSARSRRITSSDIERVLFTARFDAAFRYRSYVKRDVVTAGIAASGSLYGPFVFSSRRPGMTDAQYERFRAVRLKLARRARRLFTRQPADVANLRVAATLPELKLSDAEQRRWWSRRGPLPWWAKPHLAESMQKVVQFEDRPKDGVAPKVIGSLTPVVVLAPKTDAKPPPKPDASAPTLAVLPPRLTDASNPRAMTAAQLAGDRLAQELAATGKVRIVDRSQLDRVLNERRLDPAAKPPLIAYDAMLRIEADTARPVPETRLAVIELSTGNVLSSGRFGWPLRESDVPGMVAVCRTGVQKLGSRGKNALKVRWLGTQDVGGFDRLRPLQRRMDAEFAQAMSRAKGLVPVQHLDAADSREESLLLLMGLSRLAGGRRFSPRADATVALRLREFDATGKTFAETGVVIEFQVRTGAGKPGKWIATRGTVKEFNRLPAKVWTRLTAELAAAKSAPAVKYLNELPARRKQAEAELAAAKNVDAGLPAQKRAQRQLAHLDAALKLDPTFEEASSERLIALRTVLLSSRQSTRPVILDTARHLETFGDSRFGPRAVRNVFRTVRGTRVIQLDQDRGIALSKDDFKLLDVLKDLVERALGGKSPVLPPEVGRMIAIVARGMRGADVSERQITAWVDARLQECGRKYATTRGLKRREFLRRKMPPFMAIYAFEYRRAQVVAAQLAAESGDVDRARTFIANARKLFAQPTTRDRVLLADLQRAVAALDDKKLLAEFGRWSAGKGAGVRPTRPRGPGPERLRWPTVNVFDARKKLPAVPAAKLNDRIPLTRDPDSYTPHLAPLTAGRGRLYVAKSSSSLDWPAFQGVRPAKTLAIGFLPLDKTGAPQGRAVRQDAKSRSKHEYWSTLKWLPMPGSNSKLYVLCAREIDGKLFVGTRQSGLWTFDLKTGRWSKHDAAGGLPVTSVYSMFPLDKGRLYCTGQSQPGRGQPVFSHFVFDYNRNKASLLHRTDTRKRNQSVGFHWRLNDLWMQDGHVKAWSDYGLYDDLLGAKPRLHAVPPLKHPSGWKIAATSSGGNVVVGSRRFSYAAGALHEYDGDGKIVRSWWSTIRGLGDNRAVIAPGDAPLSGFQMRRSGELLVFFDRASLVAYSPRSDTWYGPLAAPWADYAIGARNGVWLGKGSSLYYVKSSDLLAAARKAGRALTTGEYRERRDRFIASAKPLDRAKFAVGLGQFDKAAKLIAEILNRQPDHAEARALKGYLPGNR